MMEDNKILEQQVAKLKKFEKRMTLTINLERKLIECLFANIYYQDALDARESEHEKMNDPNYVPQIDWMMSTHKNNFLQDSMLFAGNRLLVWLKLYTDSYSIKNSGLEKILTFKDEIKYLRDVRTHDYNYSLVSKKNKKKSKFKENYKNYIVHNELGNIGPNVTYTFKNSNIEDQHNIGGRFRFDLFKTTIDAAYLKTKKVNFFDISHIAEKHFELEAFIRGNFDET